MGGRQLECFHYCHSERSEESFVHRLRFFVVPLLRMTGMENVILSAAKDLIPLALYPKMRYTIRNIENHILW